MTIKTFTPGKTNKPKVGDIIFGEKSFNIGRKKNKNSNIIEVGLTLEQCIKKEMKSEIFFSKGKVFENNREVTIDNSIIDETRSKSTWVVEAIEYKPSIKLLHSILPESYFVKARKLVDSELVDEVIEFFTFGPYQNTITETLEVIGRIEE